MSNTPDEFTIRRKAAEHHIDPRTLKRALEGCRIRGAELQQRVALALEELRASASAPAQPSTAALSLPTKKATGAPSGEAPIWKQDKMKTTPAVREGQGGVLPASSNLLPSSAPILAAGVVVQQAAPPSFVTDDSAEQHGLSRQIFRRLCRAGLPHRIEGGVRVASLEDVKRWLAANPSTSERAPAQRKRDMIGAKLEASGLRPGGKP